MKHALENGLKIRRTQLILWVDLPTRIPSSAPLNAIRLWPAELIHPGTGCYARRDMWSPIILLRRLGPRDRATGAGCGRPGGFLPPQGSHPLETHLDS